MTQAEGLITGTMVKMFTIAGQVSVSGAAAGAVHGVALVLPWARGIKMGFGEAAMRPPPRKQNGTWLLVE